ncbi:MAG: hypothetical protein IKY12_04740, partial [Clostridia bacterium]|nr:hypothetical protein [Clostridia bacterium]
MIAVFALFSCAKEGASEKIAEPETSTLLVYMVGSDLEGRAAAATNDLYEMETSGIDLAYTNVVVCAGGSQYWHNENAA